MPCDIRVGIAWCTHFPRAGWGNPGGLWIRDLRHAYRGPSLFGGELREAGSEVISVTCDETLDLLGLAGPPPQLPSHADVFYFSSHGMFDDQGYRGLLRDSDWQPAQTGLDCPVVIFDTCYLMDGQRPWMPLWQTPLVGLRTRLLLGFDGLASQDRGTSLRGLRFAQLLLAGDTFADAWLRAATQTSPHRADRPIAVALGDDPADANAVLQTSSLSSIPAPRTQAVPTIAVRS